MRVELLAVGSELLYGDITNRNAAWLGQRLAEVGLEVTHSGVVGDDVDIIAQAVRTALGRADALIITGGLGPTQDDLTREALALAAEVALVRDPDVEAALRERFGRLRRDVPDLNYRQADLPVGATVLANTRGTAPGVRLAIGRGVAYALPGVPHEMEAMFTDGALPDLLDRAGSTSIVLHRLVRTAGIWESAVAEAMAPEVDRLTPVGNPVIAFLASGGQTRVKISARAATLAEAEELIAPTEAFAHRALGIAVYGVDDATLEGSVLDHLQAAGASVALAESLTGGLVAARLTSVPGASAIVRGGVIAYASDLKTSLLDVPADVVASDGAVSSACALAMAVGVRTRLGATYGLALTGVAGPSSQEGKPPGLVYLGLAGPGVGQTRELRLPGDRAQIREYAAVAALDLLRRVLALR